MIASIYTAKVGMYFNENDQYDLDRLQTNLKRSFNAFVASYMDNKEEATDEKFVNDEFVKISEMCVEVVGKINELFSSQKLTRT